MSEPELLAGLGVAMAIFLSAAGAAVASAEGGIFVMNKSFKHFVPIIQAGVLALYGLIIAVILVRKMNKTGELDPTTGYRFLSAGLAVGFGCLASGYGMALFLRQLNNNNNNTQTPSSRSEISSSTPSTATTEATTWRTPLLNQAPPHAAVLTAKCADLTSDEFRKLILIMIFLEAIGLYGLIAALFLVGV